MRRSLVIALLVVAALAPTTAMASAWFRCQVDGVARARCCCPAPTPLTDEERAAERERQRDPSRPAELAATTCCDVERSDARVRDARALPGVELALAPPPRAVVRVATEATVAVTAASAWVAPLPRGPPTLFHQHIALLV